MNKLALILIAVIIVLAGALIFTNRAKAPVIEEMNKEVGTTTVQTSVPEATTNVLTHLYTKPDVYVVTFTLKSTNSKLISTMKSMNVVAR